MRARIRLRQTIPYFIVAVARHLIQRILGIINWDDRTVRKLYEHRAIPFELYDLPEHC